MTGTSRPVSAIRDDQAIKALAKDVRNGQVGLHLNGYVTGAVPVGYTGVEDPNAPKTRRNLPRRRLAVADEQGSWSCRAVHPSAVEQHQDRGVWIQHVQRAVGLEPPKDASRLPLFNGPSRQALTQVVLVPLRSTDGGALRGVLCLYVDRGEEAAGLVAMSFSFTGTGLTRMQCIDYNQVNYAY